MFHFIICIINVYFRRRIARDIKINETYIRIRRMCAAMHNTAASKVNLYNANNTIEHISTNK